ncbi:MAG: response regulator transcription factor [Bacteroidales bacterium]|nr:response regulator transcription factor [Bacteroidales bacterium]
MTTNIILVDDHPLFRLGIRMTLEASGNVKIVGEAETSAEFFELMASQEAPDLVLLDIVLPDMSGVEIAQRLRNDYPDVRILVLSSETTISVIEHLVEIGVNGFVAKTEPTSRLMQAIDTVMCGLSYYGCDITKIIHGLAVSCDATITAAITEQERQFLMFCVDGLSLQQLAQRMNITIEQAEQIRLGIMQRIDVANDVELIRFAVRSGLATI